MSSPFDNYGRMEPSAVTIEEMDTLHKANKVTIQSVSKKLSALLVQRMKNGNFHQLKEWWKKNVVHVELKPRSLEELCKYVVAFSILAEGWAPGVYNDLVLPVQVEELLAVELQGQAGDKIPSNAEMMEQMETRIMDKLKAFIDTNAKANPAINTDSVVTIGGETSNLGTNSDTSGTAGAASSSQGSGRAPDKDTNGTVGAASGASASGSGQDKGKRRASIAQDHLRAPILGVRVLPTHRSPQMLLPCVPYCNHCVPMVIPMQPREHCRVQDWMPQIMTTTLPRPLMELQSSITPRNGISVQILNSTGIC